MIVVENGAKNNSSDDFEYVMKDTLEVYKNQQVSTKYIVYIDEAIDGPSKYRNVFNVLAGAGPEDVVEFHINSIGGNLFTGLQLFNGILTTQARTVAIAEGIVASAATLPLLACDDVVIMSNSYIMVHAASWGESGDVKSVRDSVHFHTKLLDKILRDVYDGFMSEEELDDVIENSKEYYMDADEVIQRLKVRQENLQKEVEEALMKEFKSDGENTEVPKAPSKKTVRRTKPVKTKE